MEEGYIFHPPPFLGSGYRQNHQIRMLKTNSYPVLPSFRSVAPSSSHVAPSLALLTSRGTAAGPNFSRTPLISHRRKHLRRCYDLMHICLQTRQIPLAARFLNVILAAHEWTTDEGFWIALLILSLTQSESEQEAEQDANETRQGNRSKIAYLQMLDLDSSAPFKASHLTPALVREYIATNRLSDAIELLEQRINVHPYKSQPELHTTLGMLYLFVGIQTLLNRNRSDGQADAQGVTLKALDRATRQKSRACFETAIQVSEAWLRQETARRQRIWGMRKQEENADRKRLQRRVVLWGKDPTDQNKDDEDAWPVKEHKDVRRIRKRLQGKSAAAVQGSDQAEGEDGSDAVSSASDSLHTVSEDEDLDNSDEDQEEHRGRSRDPRRSPTATPAAPTSVLPGPEIEPEDEGRVSKGPRAWARVWPSIAPIWTPSPPFAHHLAQQFLSLLTPQAKPARRTRKLRSASIYPSGEMGTNTEDEQDTDNDTHAALVVNDELQLTHDQAERRLRAILFEDTDEAQRNQGVSTPENESTPVKGEASQRQDKRKRKYQRYQQRHDKKPNRSQF